MSLTYRKLSSPRAVTVPKGSNDVLLYMFEEDLIIIGLFTKLYV